MSALDVGNEWLANVGVRKLIPSSSLYCTEQGYRVSTQNAIGEYNAVAETSSLYMYRFASVYCIHVR